MEKVIKIGVRILLGLLLTACIGVIGLYWYVTTAWKKYYTEEEVKQFAQTINSAPTLSPKFYAIHDKLYPDSRHKTVLQIYIPLVPKALFGFDGSGRGYCWPANAVYPFTKWSAGRFPNHILALGIQEYTTPEKCFDFCMYNQRQSLIYYQLSHNEDTLKPLAQLTDTTEILEFLERSEMPTYYRRRKDRLDERVFNMKRKLKQSD